MSEFQRWSSEHRTIRASRDWNALLDHGLEKPVSYIIRKNGNYIEAINGSTGKIDYGGQNNAGGISGTNAIAVIESSLNNLTSGRTWLEKIVLKGDFIISDSIVVPSYTILEVQGKITAMDGLNKSLIVNSDQTNGNSNIVILNGVIDGNSAGQSATSHGIHFVKVSDYLIEAITITDCYSYGAMIGTCKGEIRNSYFVYNTQRGITFNRGRNIIRGCEVAYTTTNDGIYIGTGASDDHTIVTVKDCYVHDNGRDGIAISGGYIYDCKIIHNWVINNSRYQIDVSDITTTGDRTHHSL